MTTTAVLAPLTLNDRCDRCPAAAQVTVVIHRDQSPLMFCGHHYREHATALDAIAVEIRDERPVHAPTMSFTHSA